METLHIFIPTKRWCDCAHVISLNWVYLFLDSNISIALFLLYFLLSLSSLSSLISISLSTHILILYWHILIHSVFYLCLSFPFAPSVSTFLFLSYEHIISTFLSLTILHCPFVFILFFCYSSGTHPGGVDVDVLFVNSCFKKIENLSLHYNGFAFKEDRSGEDAMSDVCTLYRAKAFIVDLGDGIAILSCNDVLQITSYDIIV